MPLKNFYSIRLFDPKQCSRHYATIDFGEPGGLMLTRCMPKENLAKVGRVISNPEWKEFGVDQRWIISIENVNPCTENGVETLCAKRGTRGSIELRAIQKRTPGLIRKKPDGKLEYELVPR